MKLSQLYEAYSIIFVTSEQLNICGITQREASYLINTDFFLKSAVRDKTSFLAPQKHLASMCAVPDWVHLEI